MLTEQEQQKLFQGAIKSVSLEALKLMQGDRADLVMEGIRIGIQACALHVVLEEGKTDGNNIQKNPGSSKG